MTPANTCLHCGQPGGAGARELRPYGPNGEDVCAGCTFGDGTPAERRATAVRAFAKQLAAAGPLAVLSDRGPRAATVADVEPMRVNRRARRAARRA
jgi:hypothetical protein